MGAYEDYILQYFPDKEGNLETNKPRECRICWIKNGYPPFEELAEICNSTLKTIKKYSSIYNWKGIRQKAEDIKAQDELEEERIYQKKTINELRETNRKRKERFEKRLRVLDERLDNSNLTYEEEKLIMDEVIEIDKRLTKLEEDRLRDANLPKVINDKQDHKHSGEIDIGVRMKKFLNPNNIKKAGL